MIELLRPTAPELILSVGVSLGEVFMGTPNTDTDTCALAALDRSRRGTRA